MDTSPTIIKARINEETSTQMAMAMDKHRIVIPTNNNI